MTRTVLAIAPAIFFVATAGAGAQDLPQGMRRGDAPFDAAGLTAALGGRALVFHDTSEARYGADGGYSYRYRPNGPPFVGTWETTAASEVCVVFDNGFSRCDRIVKADGRLVLITDAGLRFPVREVRPRG